MLEQSDHHSVWVERGRTNLNDLKCTSPQNLNMELVFCELHAGDKGFLPPRIILKHSVASSYTTVKV